MFKNIALFGITFFILISCKKEPSESTPPIYEDTLAHGWSKVAISSNSYPIDVFFSGNKGYVIDSKNIFISENYGNSWQHLKEVSKQIDNIGMWGKDNAIFSCPQTGNIYYTIDGGKSFDSTNIDDRIFDVFFINSTTALLAGNKLWKTTDAGKTISLVYDFKKSQTYYKTLFFTDELNGWVSFESGFYQTKDGGISWALNNLSNLSLQRVNGISFLDPLNGYVTTENKILKTINGGESWDMVFYQTPDRPIDVHFVTKDIGFANTKKQIYKTTNGGGNWTAEVKLDSKNDDARTLEIHFTDVNHGWASGYKGYILKYEN